ncbi:ribonuclease domain-containing protein [Nocardioides cynanchi]|uniref:ribonuclease domain-containing protein n=1 Tax=Nocardioides cynanchi TaxID=2558918 RepID=UPI001EE39ECE|nr:ribonuclease domain-containing protein [Nocardioides cynanchi]
MAARGRSWAPVAGAVALVLLAWVLGHGAFDGGAGSGGRAPSSSSTVAASVLPPEARHTLALIDSGGPFPYDQDGVVFENREGLLPAHDSGYYHEYTVPTPGSPDRGARRIIAGSAGELYYTGDHYRSFERITTP